MEETIIPLKFNRKLSFEEILTLIDKINEFNKIVNVSMDVISNEALAKRVSSENNIPIFEEIWDNQSEIIGSDISDLEYWADRSVVSKENFFKAMKEVWNMAIEKAAEEAKSVCWTDDDDGSIECEVKKESILKLKV